jgi:hypothetical protein
MLWVSAHTGTTSLVKCRLSLAAMLTHTLHLSQVGCRSGAVCMLSHLLLPHNLIIRVDTSVLGLYAYLLLLNVLFAVLLATIPSV